MPHPHVHVQVYALPMSEEEKNLRETFYKLCFSPGERTRKIRENFEGRDIVTTPFGGNYGVAGWAICMNGSPPRGTVIHMRNDNSRAHFILDGRTKRIGDAQVEVIRQYLKFINYTDHTSRYWPEAYKTTWEPTPKEPTPK